MYAEIATYYGPAVPPSPLGRWIRLAVLPGYGRGYRM